MVISDNIIGNKAINLLKLRKSYNVPDFFCISSKEIISILKKQGITKKEIQESFNETKKRKSIISRIINSKPYIDHKKLKKLKKKIIIRSSAIGEDGKRFSFAGIYESKISENSKKFQTDMAYVISSAFSDKVLYYSKQIGLKNFPSLSLIVQNYIDPDYSGITFTTTTYNNKKGMLINALKGHGEDAVMGKGVSEIFIENDKIPKSIIPTPILARVKKECKQIEKQFKKSQDIEWCYKKGQLYILQSRSITRNIHEEIKVWDNSNIAESYSGIVLPLTCSFAKFIYSQVYKDLARNSNIDPKKIKKYNKIFDNLLGFFYGRFYYNMINWYKMLTLYPGYERNKKNLDMMISARSKAELDHDYNKNVNFIDKLRYYPYVIFRIIRFEHDLRIFKTKVKNFLKYAQDNNFEEADLKELWIWYKDFERNLLRRWSITVDNDFLAMTWFGLFKKYAKKQGLDEKQILYQITEIKSVISAQQVNELRKITKKVYSNNHLLKLAKKSKWQSCYKEMMKNYEIKQIIEKYLKIYGGRFANELKLEAEDLESDPTYIPQLLYSYNQENIKIGLTKAKLTNSKTKNYLLSFLAARSKHYLRNREELRLLRSRVFGYSRRLFIAIGKKLEKKNIIFNYKDIFYLELDEILSAMKNKKLDIKRLIKQRKKDYNKYKKIELDNVLITRGNELPKQKNRKTVKIIKKLKGIGCSLGKVSGKITIMHKFKLPKKPLEIVVVKHTDPGWTPLFGICKGLIVENGGLLSHAAIISRELNLPCIIGVENATKLLRNGQHIIMDGSEGTIDMG